MHMSRTGRREVEGFLQRCLPLALMCLAQTVAALYIGGSVLLVGAVAMFLAGALCGALLIVSWQHYHPWFSWLLWAGPGAALTAGVFGFVVGPPLATGEVSVLGAVLVLFGCSGLGFFGLVFLLRGYVKRWLGT
jgi:sorbitol-specific phosphotransferase system component IIBC